jgi:hypothetical protein
MKQRFDPARIKRLAIIGMFSDDELMERLVLKGGNLLDVVYKVSTRSSVDVDLSIDGDFDSFEDLKHRAEAALRRTFDDDGFVVFDFNMISVPPRLSENMKSFWGGYKIDFKLLDKTTYYANENPDRRRLLAMPLGKRRSPKFCIDLSRHEYCGDKQREELDGFTVFVYSPAMFVSEKIRAICQQMPEYVQVVKSYPSARARDFVDIHVAVQHFSIRFDEPEFQRVLVATFEVKRVPLHLIGRINDQREFHRPDFVALKDTVKPGVVLHNFDFYFDFVVERCRSLESLWNE